MNNRVFTSRYRAGVFFAPGRGLFLFPLLLIPGASLFKNLLLAAVFALGAFVVSTWLWTRRRKALPALMLTSDGVKIDGMPRLEWRQIASVRRRDGLGGRPELAIGLTGPLSGLSTGPGSSPLCQIVGSHLLLLRTYLLADPPEDVEDAFNFFLRRPAIS